MIKAIYFDNSATTRVDQDVAAEAVAVMTENFGNPSSLHYLGGQAYRALGVARNQLAKVLGAPTSSIYFTSGGTQSNNIAIQGGLRANRAVGKHIVTTAIEHDSILRTCRMLETRGCSVTYVRPDPATHSIRAEGVISAVREDTALVSVMHVNNETGEILPIDRIIAGVRAKNPRTYIHCDGVQSFGKLPFKLYQYPVDMISASAHKIYGPKGVGMLYLRDRGMADPLEYGGKQEGLVNPGTESMPLACAFGLAADRTLYRMTEDYDRIEQLRAYLRERLQSTLPMVRINSPACSSPYVFNISLPGCVSHEMVSFLSLREIYVSAGSACSKGEKSHVLEAMGFSDDAISSALRISFCRYNTRREVDILVEALREFVSAHTPWER